MLSPDFLLSSLFSSRNGEVWYRLRSAVHKMMLRPQEVSYYLPLVDSVANAFTDKIEGTVGEDRVVDDLRTLVGKWILECMLLQLKIVKVK